LHSAADLKKIQKYEKLGFFLPVYILPSPIQVNGLILTKISNPIKIFKKIKHFDLKSAILSSKNPNSMLLEYFKKFSNRMKILKNEIFVFKILTIL
jgi:hypothetical protein